MRRINVDGVEVHYHPPEPIEKATPIPPPMTERQRLERGVRKTWAGLWEFLTSDSESDLERAMKAADKFKETE